MHTIPVGKALLEALEKERGEKINPRKFFEEEFWPVFFDCEDEKHLMNVSNSAFFQGSYKKSAKAENIPLSHYRKDRFLSDVEEVAALKSPVKASVVVGAMASGPAETTYGQVTDLPLNLTEDEILFSWIGGACGIGIGGGLDMFTQEPRLLKFVAKGWSYYRKLIEDTSNLKGRQIDAWNGILVHLRY